MPEFLIRLLLDEHYPAWLAAELTADGLDVQAVIAREDLRGVDDTTVLGVATAERRLVVTEDVTTFSIAMAAVPDHVAVIFCHHARFPRTRPGLARLREALVELATRMPPGISEPAAVWWLEASER